MEKNDNYNSENSNIDAGSIADDPFFQRTDLLISYHGEGDPKCGLSECPAPLNGLWWMPDSYNNTYHCVRTLGKDTANASEIADDHCDDNRDHGCNNGRATAAEDSIYCVFYDDEDFVEYYDLNQNPHQLGNDYHSLSDSAIEKYEQRLQELLS